MAQTFKVLGQVFPAASTMTTLYTVPAATQTVVSTIVVANQSATTPANIWVAVSPAGAAVANQHYVFYNVAVAAVSSMTATIGITLGATDVVRVQTSAATVSFSAFGSEIT